MRVAVVSLVSLVVALAACPIADVSPTGRTCKDDAGCQSSSPHHCELALAPPVCLPGKATVAAPKNLPPYATSSTIVARVGSAPLRGTLGVADPEGASLTIAAPTSGVLTFNGGTSSIAFDAGTFNYTFIAGDVAGNDAQSIIVSDGANAVPISIAVAVYDPAAVAPARVPKVAHDPATYSDPTSWTPVGEPTASDDVVVEGALDVDANPNPAKAASLIVAKTAHVTLHADLECNGLTSGITGGAAIVGDVTTAGDAQLLMNSGSATGVFPAIRANAFFPFDAVGALSAPSIHDGNMSTLPGAAVITTDDLAVGQLSLAEATRVEVGGAFSITNKLTISKPSNADSERIVVVHGSVDVKAVNVEDANKGAWRLIVDGVGAHTIAVGGALDAVEIRPGADVSLSADGGVRDLLLEGGLSTPTSLDVGTLHVRRLPPHAIGGTIHATTCDLPDQVALDLGAGVTCDSVK